MTKIQATVNPRLLTKANRLFTGTLSGRIIEILQNARRAGARQVVIANQAGLVTVRDDGRGIRDFQKLLDLGGSDWDQPLEASEDPAGVGLFCLAPRTLTIRSHGFAVHITEPGWTGAPVAVAADTQPLLPPDIAGGTELTFADDPWTAAAVTPCAVFTGLDVIVDGQPCPREPFVDDRAADYPELGCRIQVLAASEITPWHQRAVQGRTLGSNVLLNYHGQVVALGFRPIRHHDLYFLVDMTGAPTAIRMLLPARTCVVENDGLRQLLAALERAAFLHLQRQGRHHLTYKEFLRARELGLELPEAEPTYSVGLLRTSMVPEPIAVAMPQGHALAQCHRLAPDLVGVSSDEANLHLLAALGKFDTPLIPVEIQSEFDGYSWARLPHIDRVEVTGGKVLQESYLGSGTLICVASLSISAYGNDGKVFESNVCMAVKPLNSDHPDAWLDQVYVTPEAQGVLAATDIWFHLGGFGDDGDTYDTQEEQFARELAEYWMRLEGPHESHRRRLMEAADDLPKGWRAVTILPDGTITVRQKDDSTQTLAPPRSSAAEPT